MSEQPEALRLEDETFWTDEDCASAAAELRRLYALCEESQTVVRDLLNALPSATTHPAIIAARTLAAKLESEQ